jgi:hypothetical protein
MKPPRRHVLTAARLGLGLAVLVVAAPANAQPDTA